MTRVRALELVWGYLAVGLKRPLVVQTPGGETPPRPPLRSGSAPGLPPAPGTTQRTQSAYVQGTTCVLLGRRAVGTSLGQASLLGTEATHTLRPGSPA